MQLHEQPHHYYVYIIGDQKQPQLSIGVSEDLQRYVAADSNGNQFPKLVYYEHYDHEEVARVRERFIKSASPEEHLRLVESMNPNWLDLTDTLQ